MTFAFGLLVGMVSTLGMFVLVIASAASEEWYIRKKHIEKALHDLKEDSLSERSWRIEAKKNAYQVEFHLRGTASLRGYFNKEGALVRYEFGPALKKLYQKNALSKEDLMFLLAHMKDVVLAGYIKRVAEKEEMEDAQKNGEKDVILLINEGLKTK